METVKITKEDIRSCFGQRPKDANKGDFGYVALVGGSLPYSGAVRLAAMANCAMRSGAGVATVAAPASLGLLIATNMLEATFYPLSEEGGYMLFKEDEFEKLKSRYRCIAIGMGMGNTKESRKCVEWLLNNYEGILIIDADGLNVLSSIDRDTVKNSRAKIVLTPHLKEFERLSGTSVKDISEENKAELAGRLSRELGCIVLLKGSVTAVTDGKKAYLVEQGCPGMATAGSGDVLSGILAAVLAYNENDLLLATAAAAYINGVAGEIAEKENGQISMVASDTARHVKDAVRNIIS